MRLEHRYAVYPASVPVITSHYGTNHAVSVQRDKKEARLESELRWNRALRAIPRLIVREGFLPKSTYFFEMLVYVGDNLDIGHQGKKPSG